MAKRGRPAKPTRLKILAGNPGRRPLNKREPQPRVGAPPCPTHLDAEAKREWRRIVKELSAVGLLTHVDRAALADYCIAWSEAVALDTAIVQKGGIVKVSLGSEEKLIWNRNKAVERMNKLRGEFGMTPSSRSGLQLPAVEKETEDPIDRLMAGKPLSG